MCDRESCLNYIFVILVWNRWLVCVPFCTESTEGRKQISFAFVLELSYNNGWCIRVCVHSLCSIVKKIYNNFYYKKRSCSHENQPFTVTLVHFYHSEPFQYRMYLWLLFYYFNIEWNKPPFPPFFFPFSNSSSLFLYPLHPLFTGPIKGTEALVKQSNKVVMECTTVPRYSLNSHSFIHSFNRSKSLFFETTLFFFLSGRLLFNNFWCGSQSGRGGIEANAVISLLHLFGSPLLVWRLIAIKGLREKQKGWKTWTRPTTWLGRGYGAEQAQLSLLRGRKQRLLIRQNNETMLARHTPHSTHCLQRLNSPNCLIKSVKTL